MILSYDQITQATVCGDCARREVKIQTFPTISDALKFLGLCPHVLELCDDPDCQRCTVEALQPVNLVWVRHDRGCPRLCYGEMYGIDHPIDDKTDVVSVHPLDIPEDHPWMERLKD